MINMTLDSLISASELYDTEFKWLCTSIVFKRFCFLKNKITQSQFKKHPSINLSHTNLPIYRSYVSRVRPILTINKRLALDNLLAVLVDSFSWQYNNSFYAYWMCSAHHFSLNKIYFALLDLSLCDPSLVLFHSLAFTLGSHGLFHSNWFEYKFYLLFFLVNAFCLSCSLLRLYWLCIYEFNKIIIEWIPHPKHLQWNRM